MTAPTPIPLEARQAALDAVVANLPESARQLPDLQDTSGFFAQLMQIIWDSLGPWLRNLFPERVPGAGGGPGLVPSLLLTLFAVSILGLLLRAKTRTHRSARLRAHDIRQATIAASASIQQELQRAIKAGEWQKALRLRWSLFLRRKNLLLGKTPSEAISSGVWEPPAAPPTVTELMFGPTPATSEDFGAVDTSLSQSERRRP
jgi:hypothetical protein